MGCDAAAHVQSAYRDFPTLCTVGEFWKSEQTRRSAEKNGLFQKELIILCKRTVPLKL
jgi:hypothetical protein